MSIYSYLVLRDNIIFRGREEAKKSIAENLNISEEEIQEIIVAENCVYVETKKEVIKIFPHGILREVKA